MNIGMLWFDNDPKTELNEKIKRASAYYQQKYGQTPNQCMVNPGMVAEDPVNLDALKVIASPTILPNHLWIGFNTAVKQVGKSN